MMEGQAVAQPSEAPANHTPWRFPPPSVIPLVFPRRLALAIVMTDQGASVRAVFSQSPRQKSYLELDILSDKVPFLARELFGACIEISKEQLCLRLENGSIVSFETMKFLLAERDPAAKIFGIPYVSICQDGNYVEEYERGAPLTSMISFEVKRSVHDHSCLRVEAGAETISSIARQIWAHFPLLPPHH